MSGWDYLFMTIAVGWWSVILWVVSAFYGGRIDDVTALIVIVPCLIFIFPLAAIGTLTGIKNVFRA